LGFVQISFNPPVAIVAVDGDNERCGRLDFRCANIEYAMQNWRMDGTVYSFDDGTYYIDYAYITDRDGWVIDSLNKGGFSMSMPELEKMQRL